MVEIQKLVNTLKTISELKVPADHKYKMVEGLGLEYINFGTSSKFYNSAHKIKVLHPSNCRGNNKQYNDKYLLCYGHCNYTRGGFPNYLAYVLEISELDYRIIKNML